jgi:hypothetical protein
MDPASTTSGAAAAIIMASVEFEAGLSDTVLLAIRVLLGVEETVVDAVADAVMLVVAKVLLDFVAVAVRLSEHVADALASNDTDAVVLVLSVPLAEAVVVGEAAAEGEVDELVLVETLGEERGGEMTGEGRREAETDGLEVRLAVLVDDTVPVGNGLEVTL